MQAADLGYASGADITDANLVQAEIAQADGARLDGAKLEGVQLGFRGRPVIPRTGMPAAEITWAL